MRNDFVIFCLSYKRPNNVFTVNSLRKAGYTGDIHLVIGDDNPTMDDYIANFGFDKVHIFKKSDIEGTFDSCDIDGTDKVIVYARNYCFTLAKEMGLKYFAEFDDDYDRYEYRYPQDGKLKTINVREFDTIVDTMIQFLEDTNALTVAFAQNGDFCGGVEGDIKDNRCKRKAMNSFFCRTDRPFTFFGWINEDVNTYCSLGSRGELFFSVVDVALHQKPTQSNLGGMTNAYQDDGTYMKSFYTILSSPSFVKIAVMGNTPETRRIHHRISWNNAVPKIISDKYRK